MMMLFVIRNLVFGLLLVLIAFGVGVMEHLLAIERTLGKPPHRWFETVCGIAAALLTLQSVQVFLRSIRQFEVVRASESLVDF
jgi:uncharacterized membrane protein